MKFEGRHWVVVPPAINDQDRIANIMRIVGGLIGDIRVPPQNGGYSYGFRCKNDPETFYIGLVAGRPDGDMRES